MKHRFPYVQHQGEQIKRTLTPQLEHCCSEHIRLKFSHPFPSIFYYLLYFKHLHNIINFSMNVLTMVWQPPLHWCGTDKLLLYKKWRRAVSPDWGMLGIYYSAKDLYCGLGSVWMFWIYMDIFRLSICFSTKKVDINAFKSKFRRYLGAIFRLPFIPAHTSLIATCWLV